MILDLDHPYLDRGDGGGPEPLEDVVGPGGDGPLAPSQRRTRSAPKCCAFIPSGRNDGSLLIDTATRSAAAVPSSATSRAWPSMAESR